MNHNVFEKVLTKYWRQRLNGALTHMKDNFRIIPISCFNIQCAPYRKLVYDATFKSLLYLLLYNYRRNVCSLCSKKCSKRGLKRCCLKRFDRCTESYNREYFKITDKYNHLCDGYRGLLYYEYDIYHPHYFHNARCLTHFKYVLCSSIKPEIIKSFVP